MKIISDIIEAHIYRRKGEKYELLLLKRSSNEDVYPGIWQPITGRMKNDEKAWEAALREIREETGITPDSFFVVPNVNSYYNPQNDTTSIIPVFVGEVQENVEVQLSEEHDEYSWCSLEEALLLLAWPGQRKSARLIIEKAADENTYFDPVKLI